MAGMYYNVTVTGNVRDIGRCDGSADTGATTTVTVTADAVTDLVNFDITVTYDLTVVNVTAAENNAAFGSMNNIGGASTGTVRLMSFNTGSGSTGDGVLLSMLTPEAVGTAAQTSALTLRINSLINSSEGDITATVDDDVFTVAVTGGVPSIVDEYDEDDSDGIGKDELVNAVNDSFDGILPYTDAVTIIYTVTALTAYTLNNHKEEHNEEYEDNFPTHQLLEKSVGNCCSAFLSVDRSNSIRIRGIIRQ